MKLSRFSETVDWEIKRKETRQNKPEDDTWFSITFSRRRKSVHLVRIYSLFLDDSHIHDLRHRTRILTRKASELAESARESAHGGKKTRQKGTLYTLDGVPALNIEGRGPFNDWAVSFLSSFLSPLRLFTMPDRLFASTCPIDRTRCPSIDQFKLDLPSIIR